MTEMVLGISNTSRSYVSILYVYIEHLNSI